MKPTIEQIREAAAKFADDYEVIAVRTQEEPFELGAIDHFSNVWVDGEDTGEELDGICATMVSSPRIDMHSSESSPRFGFYFGDNVAIIGGFSRTYGEDEGEVIIHDPEVLFIF